MSLWARFAGEETPGARHHVSNLSRGGLFLDGTSPLPVGSEIALDVSIDERVARVHGRVVHATRGEDAIGMGIELDFVAADDLALIESHLRDHASTVTFA